MGYKSLLRSGIGASNRSARKAQVEANKSKREQARLEKLASNYQEKLRKIEMALKDELAKGKIDKNKFDELIQRKEEITIEKVVFGKAPYVSLAKRYITGKIDKSEYEELIKDIVPFDVLEERELISTELDNVENDLKVFIEHCKNTSDDICSHCGKQKTFFNRIKISLGKRLCGGCRRKLDNIVNYKGFDGKFFQVDAFSLDETFIEGKGNVHIGLKSEFL